MSTPPDPGSRQDRALLRTLVSFNAQVLGLTFGILFGLGLFLATNILVLKGGPNVGAHLRLLSEFFPGYRVTFLGSLLGAGYAFLLGGVTGGLIAAIYNGVLYLRTR